MKQLTENIKAILGIMFLTLSFTYIFVITAFSIPADVQVMTFVIGGCTLVLNYFMGSSASSTKKDEIISSMSQKPKKSSGSPDPDIPQKVTIQDEPIKVDVIKK